MTDKKHNIVVIAQKLHASTTATLELPKGTVWEDIKEWYVKWDILHYTTDGEAWHEIELYSDFDEIVDWKRPESVYVMSSDYEHIAEQLP